MIETLMEKGYAYQKGNSVYFSIEAYKEYGKLANIQKENLKPGTSGDSDDYDKNNIQDFVLWKGRKENEPFWETPFGDGRPGWHIECSAMSMKYLGTHFDIHMGGVDNIFPHHENEIAQSVCATGEKFVNYWLHCQHLVMDFQKMSKSLGNFFTLQDLVKKDIQPMAIRYLLISTHYRKLLNFTFDNLSQAAQSLKRIQDFIFTIRVMKPEPGKTDKIHQLIQVNENQFISHMDDDFNISGAIGVFFDFIHQVHLETNNLKQNDIENILAYVNRINSVLGVIEEQSEDTLDSEIEEKIRERENARKEKNYQLADQIRDQLLSDGIILIDTPDGVRWKKNPKP
jgi:cysteinyl-tRNA synthetase